MPAPNTIPGDIIIGGNLQAASITLPTNAVSNSVIVSGSPGNYIESSKAEHKRYPIYVQEHGIVAFTKRVPLFLPRASGTIETVELSSVIANIGAATITAQLLKNGTNILSATLQLTNADAAFARKLGTITGGQETYTVTDTFEVSITATAGGGTLGQALSFQLKCKENPS